MSSPSNLFAGLLPRPRLRPGANGARRAIERILIFARLPNPSFDYYLAGRMAAANMPPARVVDIRDHTFDGLEADGSFVVFCRYLSSASLTWVERHEAQLAGIGYFTDDDISAFVASNDARLGYRFFQFGLGLWPLRRLNRLLDQLWVSTPALAELLNEARPILLPPAPPYALGHAIARNFVADKPLKIIFHAKAIHETEHAFLVSILMQVIRARPGHHVEISADAGSAKHWRGVEGVTIVPEIPWPLYIEKTREEGADIGLVPLLPSRVNSTRADTKRIDIARMGAAGIFSACGTYGFGDESGEICLKNEAILWIETLIRLIDEPDFRAKAAKATSMRVEKMSALAQRGIPGLGF